MPKSNASASAASVSALTTSDVLRSYLASTVTYNNNATLADTALSVPVEAGAKYAIEAFLPNASVAKGVKFDFGGTATITNFIGNWQSIGGDDPLAFYTSLYVTSAGADFPAGFDTFTTHTVFTGSVEINAAGTFLVRGAQQSANLSDTTLLRGSTLILTKMS